jgi:transmembrane sensor
LAADQTHIDNLIAKNLAGEASREEQQQLWQWMDESEDNQKYFGDIRFVHDKTVASHPYVRVDTGKAWDIVKQQMNGRIQKISGTKVENRPVYKITWPRIAAGLILLLGSTALFYLWLIKPSLPVTYSIASADSSIRHTFINNTQVVLNRKSKIIFKQRRKEKKNELILSGEAFIQVKHSPDTQLIVMAEETFIKDIGTAFNVKAYPGSNKIEVYVESGEVEFYTSSNPGIRLSKGKAGLYDKVNKTFHEIHMGNANILSYKTKLFVFKNTRLADIIDQLNFVYPQNISLANPGLANCTLTVTFDNEPVGTIVDIIAETLGLQVSETAGGYIINGEHCISQE